MFRVRGWRMYVCGSPHKDRSAEVCVCVCVSWACRFPAHADLTLVGPEFLGVTCQNTQQPHQL